MKNSEPCCQTHTETITSTDHTYTIHLGGNLDGINTRDPVGYSSYTQAYEPNRSVRLENIGKTAIVNPWIIVNDKRDWRSIDHILREILHDGMTDAEKAHAIWHFACKHRYHYTCADDEVKDTVKMLNSYGYTLCWDEAYTVANLWQAAGLSIRRGYPHGHCTTEVYYDSEFHLLDSDEHLCYLLRDNHTVANEEDLARDHDLVKRGHAYGILQGENRTISEGAAALFFYTGPRTGERPQLTTHKMNITLRPGESLTWAWENRGKYHGFWERPKRLANGQMHYTPDLTDLHWTDHNNHWIADETGCHPTLANQEAILSYTIQSPYVIVGGKLDLTMMQKPQDKITIDISRDGQTYQELPLLNTNDPQSFSLDPFFPPDTPASYSYHIRIRAIGDPKSLKLKYLATETDLQMAPLSLPALQLGTNTIHYTADTKGQARITHLYEEKEAEPAPIPPDSPTHPSHNAQTKGTQFTFSWPVVQNATDYHFQLSAHKDMASPLSPVFDKLISRTPSKDKPEWHIPYEGLLNPNQTYYWRIRPRNAEGLWGSWSAIWSFTPQAPGVPLNPELIPNHQNRILTVRWQSNPEGNAPDHYEIYGSNERGFTISRDPYDVVTGNKKTEPFPANLITTTHQTNIQLDASKAFAFYRLVAVDNHSVRSGPSDLIEAPRPMIVSMPATHALAEHLYTYQLITIASIGELRCESNGSQRYVSAFRDGDTLRFLLDEGPPWTHLDEHTGLFTARPKREDVGTHTVTIRVQNGQGGLDMQGFDLHVQPVK